MLNAYKSVLKCLIHKGYSDSHTGNKPSMYKSFIRLLAVYIQEGRNRGVRQIDDDRTDREAAPYTRING